MTRQDSKRLYSTIKAITQIATENHSTIYVTKYTILLIYIYVIIGCFFTKIRRRKEKKITKQSLDSFHSNDFTRLLFATVMKYDKQTTYYCYPSYRWFPIFNFSTHLNNLENRNSHNLSLFNSVSTKKTNKIIQKYQVSWRMAV